MIEDSRLWFWWNVGYGGGDEELRYLPRRLVEEGYFAWAKKRMQPMINWADSLGMRIGFELHNPYGAMMRGFMSFDQRIGCKYNEETKHIAEDDLTELERWLRRDSKIGHQFMAYIGRPGRYELAKSALHTIASDGIPWCTNIGIDNTGPRSQDHASYAAAILLQEAKRSVVCEATPPYQQEHWWEFDTLVKDKTFLRRHIAHLRPDLFPKAGTASWYDNPVAVMFNRGADINEALELTRRYGIVPFFHWLDFNRVANHARAKEIFSDAYSTGRDELPNT